MNKNNYIGQAWLVLSLALCFGASLATVQVALKPRIDENKLADTVGQIPALVPGATQGEAEMVGDVSAYRAVDAQGNHVGWVLPAVGQGFADKIELLVGLDKDLNKITGLYILDQKETPGLGNRITEDGWRDQFGGKSIGVPLEVTKAQAQAEAEVEAVTGATISSESVVGIVNATVSKFRAAVDGQI